MEPKDLDIHLEVKNLDGKHATIRIYPDKQDISQAIGRLAPYKALPRTFRPVLEKVGDYVRTQMIPYTFKNEGPGWKPLARRTIAERVQAGYGGQHPILRRSGDLYKELTDKSHPKHIEVVKVGKRARLEIGGSSEKFIQNQLGKGDPGQRLPARPMIPGTGNIPLHARDRIAIKGIIMKAIQSNNDKL